MFKHAPVVMSLLAVGLFWSSSAQAQSTRTWVSGVGDDANPCSRTAPCKTFAGAISKTVAAGEIDVLDPGGFGALTVTKSIVVDGTSAMAGVLVSATNGIVIAAGTTDVVFLRNLHFAGIGTGLTAINIISAGTVYIDNCFVDGFSVAGIGVNTASGNPATSVYVSNTTIANNPNAILVNNASPANVIVQGSSLMQGSVGISFTGTGATNATVSNTTIAGFSTVGISNLSTSTQVNVDGSNLNQNADGVDALAGSVYLSNVMTSQNANALVTGPGVIYSFGNNTLNAGNTKNGAPTYVIPLQ